MTRLGIKARMLLFGLLMIINALSPLFSTANAAYSQTENFGVTVLMVGQTATFASVSKDAEIISQNKNIATVNGQTITAVGVGFVELRIKHNNITKKRYIAVQLPSSKENKMYDTTANLQDDIHTAASDYKRRMHFLIELSVTENKNEKKDNANIKKAIETFVPTAEGLNIAYCDTYYLSYLYERLDKNTVQVQASLTFGFNPAAAVSAKYRGDSIKLNKKEKALYERCQAVIKTLDLKKLETRYEIALTVHDHLVLNMAFDVEATEKGHWLEAEDSYNAYGALVNGKATCKGYAQAMKLLLEAVDVPCDYVVGKRDGWHAWNRVQLDDKKWYNIDASADDPIPDVKGRVSHKYFCVTDKQLRKTHSWDDTAHTCTATTYSYVNIQKLLKAKED